MKIVLSVAFIALLSFGGNVFGQNQFPTAQGSNVLIDGGAINMVKHYSVGGWTRGLHFFNETTDSNARYGAVGIYGEGSEAQRLYLAHGNSPWSSVKGINILSNGNVGIGVLNPGSLLDIKQTVDASSGGIKLRSAENWHDLFLFVKDSGERVINAGNEGNGLLVLNRNGGKVGIGTGGVTPMGQVEIRTPDDKAVSLNWDQEAAITFRPNNGNAIFHISHDHGNGLAFSQGGNINGGKLMTLKSSGNLGIGVDNPGTWKLAVNGKVRAQEINVETGWADFVFEDRYDLPDLKQVEDFIKTNGHLKDIPSAKEVETNGIFLGEMNAILLQKIEELTLYTIAQEKALKKKEDKILSLEERILKLEKRMEGLAE